MRIIRLFVLVMLFAVSASAQTIDDMRFHPGTLSAALSADSRGIDGSTVQNVNVTAWPNGRIPVVFDVATSVQRQRFFTACAYLGTLANVSCVPRTNNEVPYLRVTREQPGACWAFIGSPMPFLMESRVNLDDACYGNVFPGVDDYSALLHELLHVYGLIHEHQRIDRDDFLTIHWERMQSGSAGQFVRLAINYSQSPYDFRSIMHYHRFAFSTSQLPTLTPRGYDGPIGNVMPSAGDADDLRALYGARPSTTAPVLELVNGSTNPVALRWTGGAGDYTILAGSAPGLSDYGVFPMGAQTSVVAIVPRGVVIHATILSAGRRSNSVTVFVQ